MGARPVLEITDDDVFFELERIGSEPALVYMGRDAHGNPIHRSKGSRKTPGTVNRFRDALSGVFNWAIRTRRLPNGTLNPCHAVKKHPEHPGIVRFLDMTDACACWPPAALRHGRGCTRWSSWASPPADAGANCVGCAGAMSILSGARLGSSRARTTSLGCCRSPRRWSTNSPAFAPKTPSASSWRCPGPWYSIPTASLTGLRLRVRYGTALKAGHVKDFRLHDPRRTTASYLAQSGASLLQVADVLGHKTMSMVRRYSHLTVGSKAPLIDKVLGDIE